MSKTVESYKIGANTASITAEDNLTYKVWWGGSALADAYTLPEARKILHGYALSSFSAERSSLNRRLIEVSETIKRLGSDPYLLARFLKD